MLPEDEVHCGWNCDHHDKTSPRGTFRPAEVLVLILSLDNNLESKLDVVAKSSIPFGTIGQSRGHAGDASLLYSNRRIINRSNLESI